MEAAESLFSVTLYPGLRGRHHHYSANSYPLVPEDLPLRSKGNVTVATSAGSWPGSVVAQVVADPGLSPSPGPLEPGVTAQKQGGNRFCSGALKKKASDPGIASLTWDLSMQLAGLD